MSLSLLITINLLADVALLALLSYVMSRASRLRPHTATLQASRPLAAERAPLRQRYTPSARSTRTGVARQRARRTGPAGAQPTAARES
jgi:hypothetical protein